MVSFFIVSFLVLFLNSSKGRLSGNNIHSRGPGCVHIAITSPPTRTRPGASLYRSRWDSCQPSTICSGCFSFSKSCLFSRCQHGCFISPPGPWHALKTTSNSRSTQRTAPLHKAFHPTLAAAVPPLWFTWLPCFPSKH